MNSYIILVIIVLVVFFFMARIELFGIGSPIVPLDESGPMRVVSRRSYSGLVKSPRIYSTTSPATHTTPTTQDDIPTRPICRRSYTGNCDYSGFSTSVDRSKYFCIEEDGQCTPKVGCGCGLNPLVTGLITGQKCDVEACRLYPN